MKMEGFEELVADFDLGNVVHFEFNPEGLGPVVLESIPAGNLGLIYEEFDDADEFIPEDDPESNVSKKARAVAEKDQKEWLVEESKETILSREDMKAYIMSTKNVNTGKKTKQVGLNKLFPEGLNLIECEEILNYEFM